MQLSFIHPNDYKKQEFLSVFFRIKSLELNRF